jgi:peptidoglycan-associated lipoprotein
MAAKVFSVRGKGGPGRRRPALGILLATFLAAPPLTPASAQTVTPEQQPAVAPLTTPDSSRDTARQQAADERMAALLLSEAREELELGDLRNARRRLEILVTRFASTSVSPRARRLLEQLSLIDGGPMPPMPKAAPVETRRAGEPSSIQLATRAPGASILEADFSATGDRLFFADGSDDAGGRGRRVLREKANWLRRHPQVFVRIEGYADDTGSDDMNSALALRRAETVRDLLVEAGISATRMHIAAFGRENRVATCLSPECAAQNRRAVLILTDARGVRLGAPPPQQRPPPPGRRDR